MKEYSEDIGLILTLQTFEGILYKFFIEPFGSILKKLRKMI